MLSTEQVAELKRLLEENASTGLSSVDAARLRALQAEISHQVGEHVEEQRERIDQEFIDRQHDKDSSCS